MPPIHVWGPPIWNLFHTLAEKIHEDKFEILGEKLLFFIKRISTNLPCPSCSQHAAKFFTRAPPNAFSNKKAFKESLYMLHNVVNRRRKVPLHDMDVLEQYKHRNIIGAYNKFIAVYNTKGNMKLLTDTFQRQMIVRDFQKWIRANLLAFK
tara:strand:+ start:329 stop:781 length:453 start_codon:yes stop_codon:yes gene_type:complete